jgi:hypothetical protein
MNSKWAIVVLMGSVLGCSAGTMDVERCLPGELGCKKMTYAKYYRGEQMTRNGSLRLIAAAALGERDVDIEQQILYSVGATADGASAQSGNIRIYASNMTGQNTTLHVDEIHIVMNDNNQRFKINSSLALGPYETRWIAAFHKDIDNFSTKFIVKAFLRYNEQQEELTLNANRLSVDQVRQIQSLHRPL